MEIKDTYDGKIQQPLFVQKVVIALVLFWIQSFQAQLTFSGGLTIYSEQQDFVLDHNADYSINENRSDAKIYLSSDVNISDLDAETDYETVRVSNPKKIIASRFQKGGSKKKTIHKTKSAKQRSVETDSPMEETFSSARGSDITISIQHINQTAVAQTQNQVLNYFVKVGFTCSKICVLRQIKTQMPTYILQGHSKIYSDSYAVRPPPFSPSMTS